VSDWQLVLKKICSTDFSVVVDHTSLHPPNLFPTLICTEGILIYHGILLVLSNICCWSLARQTQFHVL